MLDFCCREKTSGIYKIQGKLILARNSRGCRPWLADTQTEISRRKDKAQKSCSLCGSQQAEKQRAKEEEICSPRERTEMET